MSINIYRHNLEIYWGGDKNIITYLTKRVFEDKRRFTTYILLYTIINFSTLY
jgi:hypothetical protein